MEAWHKEYSNIPQEHFDIVEKYIRKHNEVIDAAFGEIFNRASARFDRKAQHKKWKAKELGLTRDNIQMLDAFVDAYPEFGEEGDPHKIIDAMNKVIAKLIKNVELNISEIAIS